jgi:hypothetical protein
MEPRPRVPVGKKHQGHAIMPHYRFTSNVGTRQSIVDICLESDDAAWDEAVRSFGETMVDLRGDWRLGERLLLIVTDERNTNLYEIECQRR